MKKLNQVSLSHQLSAHSPYEFLRVLTSLVIFSIHVTNPSKIILMICIKMIYNGWAFRQISNQYERNKKKNQNIKLKFTLPCPLHISLITHNYKKKFCVLLKRPFAHNFVILTLPLDRIFK